jgi:hypothetical protein
MDVRRLKHAIRSNPATLTVASKIGRQYEISRRQEEARQTRRLRTRCANAMERDDRAAVRDGRVETLCPQPGAVTAENLDRRAFRPVDGGANRRYRNDPRMECGFAGRGPGCEYQ